MKSGTREVCMSPGMAYWSVIQPELVVEHTGVGMVMTGRSVALMIIVVVVPSNRWRAIGGIG